MGSPFVVRSKRSKVLAAALGVASLLAGIPRASAGLPGFPTIDPNSLVSDDVVKAMVTTFGFGLQHRPYEPATPLGTQLGLDVSVEATLIKVPASLFDALASMGFELPNVPSLPFPKLHLHKGFGDFLDLGWSGIWYAGSQVQGADAKIVFLQGEEGPTYAFRFCYTYTNLAVSTLRAKTQTFSPQLLMSKRLDFADPYIGVAYEYVIGSLDADITSAVQSMAPPGTPVPPIGLLHKVARNQGGQGFAGISLRVPRSGLRATMELSYNTAGTSTMGVKVGFTF